MSRNVAWKPSIIVLLVFLIAVYGKRNLIKLLDLQIDQLELRVLHHYIWWLVPVLFATSFLLGNENIFKELGLQSPIGKGFLYAFLCTLPMLIGYAIFGQYNSDENLLSLLRKSILPGFMEEVLFRGFLFGLLFRKFGWGFIPAGIIGAVIFGFQHLYQGDGLMESLGIFAITFIGALWFAWLYIEWEENLWLVIFLHTLMNLYWLVFDISDSGALGGQEANIFRAITIAITVFLTFRSCKQRGVHVVNRSNLI